MMTEKNNRKNWIYSLDNSGTDIFRNMATIRLVYGSYVYGTILQQNVIKIVIPDFEFLLYYNRDYIFNLKINKTILDIPKICPWS